MTLEFTPTPNIGWFTGGGDVKEVVASSVILILHENEIPWEPTYAFSKICNTNAPYPGLIGKRGFPDNSNVPLSSVDPVATR